MSYNKEERVESLKEYEEYCNNCRELGLNAVDYPHFTQQNYDIVKSIINSTQECI